MTNLVNTARIVRPASAAGVVEVCMHEVTLGREYFCPRCPTASFPDEPKVNVAGIPFVIVEDPKMPPDQIEFRSSNGQVVRVVNIGPALKSSVHPGPHCSCAECQNRYPSTDPASSYQRTSGE